MSADGVEQFLNEFGKLGYNLSQYILGITDKWNGPGDNVYTIFYKTNDEIESKLRYD